MKRSFKHLFRLRLLPFIIAYLGKICLRIIMWTCRFQIEGLEKFVHVASKKRCILMLWHNRLAMVAEIMNRNAPQLTYSAFISKSNDGEALAILANSYRCGKTIRVSHNARHQALRKMITNLKTRKEVIVITPDGPRGPRYEIKPGIALAAQESSAVVIPFTWTASHFWQLDSWDKLIIPKPFSKIVVLFGEMIDLQDPGFTVQLKQEDKSQILQQALLTLDKRACLALTSDESEWPQ